MWKWKITDPKGNNITVIARSTSEARRMYFRMFGQSSVKSRELVIERGEEADVPTILKPDFSNLNQSGKVGHTGETGPQDSNFTPTPPIFNEDKKPARNAPCPCGALNGDGRPRKYKNCCMKGAGSAGKGGRT